MNNEITRRSAVVGTGSVVVGAGLAACNDGRQAANIKVDMTVDVTSVPVGSGVVDPNKKVVITQPKKGQFKAFSAICTHEFCTVTSVNSKVIQCPCHGSEFDITTGAVVGGPAPTSLTEKKVTVNAGKLHITG